MKSILFLERKELAASVQQYLQLPYVQMIHSEDLFKQHLQEADELVVVHKKILDENTVQNLNRFYMTRKGARLILFYDVLFTQTPSLFPTFATALLFEKRRELRNAVQLAALWKGEQDRNQVEVQNLSGLGALISTSGLLKEKLGLISFELSQLSPEGRAKDFRKYWGKVRWQRDISSPGERSNFLYGLYFVAQDG